MATPFSETWTALRLFMAEAWRRVLLKRATLGTRLFYMGGSGPDHLIVAPSDLRLADPYAAAEICAGRFALGGRAIDTGGASIFEMNLGSGAVAHELHGFRWLRHLRAAENEKASVDARALVTDWIEIFGNRISGPAWQADVLSCRIMSWLSHSPVLLRQADHQFYFAFLRSLSLQLSHLRRIASLAPDGEVRLRVRVTLAMASLCLPSKSSVILANARNLDRELERQILADGTHISRNPQVIVDLLTDLLPLRQTYINLAHPMPDKLISSIDRMFVAIKFFRHSNGEIALFNGATATPAEQLMTILRYDETAGVPFRSMPNGHFQRLSAGESVVLADTGSPPAGLLSAGTHAGCLSFEFSSGRQRIFVNGGAPFYPNEDYERFARMTAAHSTVVFDDTSSSRLSASHFLGPVVIGGVRRVSSEPINRADGSLGFSATHDGYLASAGVLHTRQIVMSADGRLISGVESFKRADGRAVKAVKSRKRPQAVARFHLHPRIHAIEAVTGQIRLSFRGAFEGGDEWLFISPDVTPTIEDDIFFADMAGPRRSLQICLHFALADHSEIGWYLRRV